MPGTINRKFDIDDVILFIAGFMLAVEVALCSIFGINSIMVLEYEVYGVKSTNLELVISAFIGLEEE